MRPGLLTHHDSPSEVSYCEKPDGPRLFREVCSACEQPWPCDGHQLAEEVRRLQALLLDLADASGAVLGLSPATIAQTRGVDVAQKLARVQAEVDALRKERQG